MIARRMGSVSWPRGTAIKARAQAANLLHALILTAPEDLRAELAGGTLTNKIRRCARLRPGPAGTAREACKLSLRSAARRWQHLTDEITVLEQAIAAVTAHAAPKLLNQFGVGPDVAAALLIAAGGNPTRLRREASFAALCGVNPCDCHQPRRPASPSRATPSNRSITRSWSAGVSVAFRFLP